LAVAGFCWGFAITASVAWAPWISELYPARIRSSAMSIFNWGRIVSMTAPLITGQIAASFGLEAAMSLAVVGFAAGALVWFALPETAAKKRSL
jgi:dipeptide/tripeptide permease